jgi:hypothetical protein
MMVYLTSLAIFLGWLVVELKDILDNYRLKNSLALPILKNSFIFSLISLIIRQLLFPELLTQYLKEISKRAKATFSERRHYDVDDGNFLMKHRRNNSR